MALGYGLRGLAYALVCYPRRAVGRLAFLTDRSPADALPAVQSLGFDLKIEPLSPESLTHLADLAPVAVLADGVQDPELAFRLLTALAATRLVAPVVVVLGPADVERFAWAEVADDFLRPTSTAAEIRVRLAMLTRRTGGGDDASLRLGPLAMNIETYQVSVSGALLDLTYKEFELLRFLVQRPGRVFTRSELLQEVWGYNFYGGTRTVDVHVRRLRAKLGAEHEGLIQTVRGVGYRAAEARQQETLSDQSVDEDR
jgi:DNA-binding response OmpR family regulator